MSNKKHQKIRQISTPNVEQLDLWRQEAVRLLTLGEVEQARECIRSLQQFIPEHPVVVDLKRRAAVIDFNYPLERVAFEPSTRPLPEQSSIELVAFHAESLCAPNGAAHDYLPALRYCFESAALRAPAAKRILLSDEHSKIPVDIGVHEVRRFPLNMHQLMYERMRVQLLYLEQRAAEKFSLLIDSDVLINKDPCAIFAQQFDIGLTWRREVTHAPFNGGAIFVSDGTNGTAFFKYALDCYQKIAAAPDITMLYPNDLRGWWGDQFALAATVGHRAYARKHSAGLSVGSVRVLFFPCNDYNFTAPEGGHDPTQLAGKFLIHYKGNRKGMQANYLAAMRGYESI